MFPSPSILILFFAQSVPPTETEPPHDIESFVPTDPPIRFDFPVAESNDDVAMRPPKSRAEHVHTPKRNVRLARSEVQIFSSAPGRAMPPVAEQNDSLPPGLPLLFDPGPFGAPEPTSGPPPGPSLLD